MPTYDYMCKKCNHHFEVFQKMSDAPLTKCPKCSSEVKRLIGGGTGMIFKGSGFYITDYKKAGQGSEKRTEKETTEKKSEKKDSSLSNEKTSKPEPRSKEKDK